MIIFNADNHTYTNSLTNEKYISVTTLLGKFKSEFEKLKVAQIVADRKGIPVEAVLEEWEKINKDSKEYGTAVHKALEDFCRHGIVDPAYEKIIKQFKKLGDFSEKSGTLLEHLVYNHQYQIAGTSDIIKPDGVYFDVFDTKTNKKINFFSKYNRTLKYPLEHLEDCEYNSYALQLSIYAYFYSQLTGRKVRQLAIFHYDREDEVFNRYPVPYLKNDVEIILACYRYEKK